MNNRAEAAASGAIVALSAHTSESELDEAVSRVKRAKGDAAVSGWQIGRYLSDIHERQLWKLRTVRGEHGHAKARWKTWEAFCAGEIGLSVKTALNLIDVAIHYTEAQARAFGTAKLGLVLTAPPEDQRRIEQTIQQGATYREVELEVREARERSGHRKSNAGRPRHAPVPTNDAVVTMPAQGVQQVKLYQRPASLKGIDLATLRRAKRLADQPVGWLALHDGRRLHIAITEDAKGNLVAKLRMAHEGEESGG